MEYFEKLKLQAEQFSEMSKRRSVRVDFLYKMGFSCDEVNNMGYGWKKTK
jgi:hypothetical protein